MPHVELSLIDSRRLSSNPAPKSPTSTDRSPPPDRHASTQPARTRIPPGPVADTGSLRRWASAVTGATEPSLVLDAESVIVAASNACAELLGCGEVAGVRGHRLRDAMVHLVDFSDPPDRLGGAEADKIPPLLAISSGRLARGLIRVANPTQQNTCIMDAIATPLWEDDAVVGSLTFFSQVDRPRPGLTRLPSA